MPKLFSNLNFHINLFIQYLYSTFFHEVVLQMWRNIWNKIKKILSLKHVYLSCHRHQIPPPHFQYWYVPSLYIFTTLCRASLFIICDISFYFVPRPFSFYLFPKLSSFNQISQRSCIYIYLFPSYPLSLILSIFTFLIVLKYLYKMWWKISMWLT